MTVIQDDEFTTDDLTRECLAWAAAQFVTEREAGEITVVEFAEFAKVSEETARVRLGGLVKAGKMSRRRALVDGREVGVYKRTD